MNGKRLAFPWWPMCSVAISDAFDICCWNSLPERLYLRIFFITRAASTGCYFKNLCQLLGEKWLSCPFWLRVEWAISLKKKKKKRYNSHKSHHVKVAIHWCLVYSLWVQPPPLILHFHHPGKKPCLTGSHAHSPSPTPGDHSSTSCPVDFDCFS